MAARSKRKSASPAPRTARSRSGPAPRSATNRTAMDRGATAAELRDRLGLTRPVFARLVGVSERTVADWERAKDPKPASPRALQELRSVIEACERVMKPEFVGTWIVTPNEALAGFKAIELIERGETSKVLRALFYVEAGIPL